MLGAGGAALEPRIKSEGMLRSKTLRRRDSDTPSQCGPVDRPGLFFIVQVEARAPSPKASEFGIDETPDRLLDVAAHQSDIAEFTIVQLSQRFDRRPAIQIGCDGMRPNPDPAERLKLLPCETLFP